jgi:hypothetical protein
MTTSVVAEGVRISAACIPNPGGSSPPLEGKALYDHLSRLAGALRVRDAIVRVPVAPAPSCGLIEGSTAPNGMSVKTEFCYGPNGYLIVETTTDRSARAEDAASVVLASIAQRTDQVPKIENNFSPVER